MGYYIISNEWGGRVYGRSYGQIHQISFHSQFNSLKASVNSILFIAYQKITKSIQFSFI